MEQSVKISWAAQRGREGVAPIPSPLGAIYLTRMTNESDTEPTAMTLKARKIIACGLGWAHLNSTIDEFCVFK